MIQPCVPASNIVCNKQNFVSAISSLKSYNFSYINECCNTTNCNSQSSYCISSQLLADALSANNSSFNESDLIISDSCSSSSSTPIATVNLVVSLRVNLVYISAYNNLTSNESLTFIANLKSFVKLIFFIYLFKFCLI